MSELHILSVLFRLANEYELTEPFMKTRIESITTACEGFRELQSESMAMGFNMLRRLEENWLNRTNCFDKPGEKLSGFFVDGLLIGVCGLNQDPYLSSVRAGRLRHLYVGREWRRKQIGMTLLQTVLEDCERCFDFISTNAPQSAFAFYERAGFTPLNDVEKVTHRLYLEHKQR